MKKIAHLILVGLLILSTSCEKHELSSLNQEQKPFLIYSQKPWPIKVWIKFVRMHQEPLYGPPCYGTSPCIHCTCPLGICICAGIRINSTKSLTDSEIANHWGNGIAETDSISKFIITFNQETALPDSTISIDEDYMIKDSVAWELGYDSILLHNGVYSVNMDTSLYGTVAITADLYH